jgi:hypothetical protein
MSADPKAPDEATPQRDQHDNAEFGPTEAVGQGYPEEQPAEVVPDGVDPEQRSEQQPQRSEG